MPLRKANAPTISQPSPGPWECTCRLPSLILVTHQVAGGPRAAPTCIHVGETGRKVIRLGCQACLFTNARRNSLELLGVGHRRSASPGCGHLRSASRSARRLTRAFNRCVAAPLSLPDFFVNMSCFTLVGRWARIIPTDAVKASRSSSGSDGFIRS